MPSRGGLTRTTLTMCLIFILIGMGGVLFSTKLDDKVLRNMVLVLSVGMPVFGVGNLLARIHARGLQRVVLFTGVLLLLVGALATVADFPGTIMEPLEVPPEALALSRWAGMLGLGAGLFAILFSVMRREEELEEIGQRFRGLAEHMNDGFVLSQANGQILHVNGRFLEMTGMRRSEVIGRDSLKLAKELKVERMLPHIEHRRKARASEYIVDYEVDGEERHFSISGTPIFDRRGEHAGTITTMRDITDRVEMSRSLERYAQGLQRLVEEQTQQLRQSEERLRGLLLHMNEGFLTVDSAFRIRFVNDRIAEVLGVPAGELVGRDVFEFVESAGRGKLLGSLELAGSGTQRRLQQEVNLLRQGGDPLPVVIAVARVQGTGEEGPRYSMVITDVSAQKGMQRQLEVRASQLESANEELKMLDRAKDSFLSNVTHELRTPLSTIRGYLEMLDSGSLGALKGPQDTALRVMGRNAERLGTLIEEMIEFSRMQIRGVQLKMALFSMETLVQECVSSAQPQAVAKDLTLNSHVQSGLGPVWGDRDRLSQVLTNLLSNAVKFTSSGGSVQATVTARPGDCVAVSVSDTGIGIDGDHLERVFDKFFQVDSSLSRRYEGAGIGLSIAKSIAEAHGGAIELESDPGVGSTFTLVLPGALFDTHYMPSNLPDMDCRKALVVSGSDEFNEALSATLHTWDIEVRAVGGGHEGVRVFREGEWDVVVVDESTTDVSGPTAVSLLCQEGDGVHVVLLVREDSSDLEAGLLCSPVKLIKPFSARDLFEKVTQARAEEVAFAVEPEDDGGVEQDAQPNVDVLIVDPDADFMEWMETGLRKRNLTARCVSDMEEAVAFARESNVPLAFVDIDSAETEVAGTVSRLCSELERHGGSVFVMTGLPGERTDLPKLAGTLYKPFGLQEIVDVIGNQSVARDHQRTSFSATNRS